MFMPHGSFPLAVKSTDQFIKYLIKRKNSLNGGNLGVTITIQFQTKSKPNHFNTPVKQKIFQSIFSNKDLWERNNMNIEDVKLILDSF